MTTTFFYDTLSNDLALRTERFNKDLEQVQFIINKTNADYSEYGKKYNLTNKISTSIRTTKLRITNKELNSSNFFLLRKEMPMNLTMNN